MVLVVKNVLTGKRLARQRFGSWLLFLLIVVLLVACDSEVDFDQPPDIVYGEDVCERCSMIINEARYAAAYVTADGEAHRFDDIGGMLVYNQELAGDVTVFWVHDFDSEEWLKAEQAHFVKGDHITPMGFGIVAFAGLDRAEAWAAEEGGTVMSFADLLAEGETGEYDHE